MRGVRRSFTGLSNPGSDCPMTTLHGKSYIEEKLFDLTFHVSPYAFFQVNTPVAEILYRNKCSFTIGLNKAGEKCVGFRMGNFINGNVCVGEVE